MKRPFLIASSVAVLLATSSIGILTAQERRADRPTTRPADTGGSRPGGFFGGGPGGPGGMGQERKLVAQFDKDKDGRLNKDERQAARELIKKERASGRGGRGPGGPGGFGPGAFVAPQILDQADKDADRKLTKVEFTALADAWFDKLDPEKTGKVSEGDFADRFGEVLPPPPGPGGPPPADERPRGDDRQPRDVVGPEGGGPVRFGPGRFLGMPLFTAADADHDGSLTRAELKGAFEKWFSEWDRDKAGSLTEERLRDGLTAVLPRPQFGGAGGPGRRGNQEPPRPGPRISPQDVKTFPDSSLYEPTILRTLCFDFENDDWEAELSDFSRTDVEVPATLTVDGKKYPSVGVAFRGMSSQMVGTGYKRPLNVSIDFGEKKQRLYGYKTLNLLNGNGDPTLLKAVLYSHIARQYIPAPRANLVKVVINGESWGVYTSAQQFNKEFLRDFFDTDKGVRWKAPGSPGGRASLAYLGDDVEAYKRVFEIKSGGKEAEQGWKDLIQLCKTLNETPPDKLEEALAPMLDVEGALWFLALENVLINSDGYWTRTSDYNLFRDAKGKFHIIPHDMNEAFQPGRGPGMGRGGPGGRGGARGRGRGDAGAPGDAPRGGPGEGRRGGGERFGQGGPTTRPLGGGLGAGGFGGPGRGPGGGGMELDPLVAANDPNKPLLSKLLAVPGLRQKYLRNVRTIAEQWLDWEKLGPLVEQYRSLIEKEVEADTRKLDSFEAFKHGVGAEPGEAAPGEGRQRPSLKQFAEQRRKYLLNHAEVKKVESARRAARSRG